MKVGKGSRCTEESHLEGCSPLVRDVYARLKSTFLSAGSAVTFKPVKRSVRVWIGTRRNIAAIFFNKEHLLLECRKLVENDTHDILKHHRVTRYSDPPYTFERVRLCDADHWDEIQKLIARLLKRHRGALPNLRLPSPGTSEDNSR